MIKPPEEGNSAASKWCRQYRPRKEYKALFILGARRIHTIFHEHSFIQEPREDTLLTIYGEEAHHAVRVVRCREDDSIRVCNGQGLVLECIVAEILKESVSKKQSDQSPWKLVLRINQVRMVPQTASPVHVFACIPKAERLSDMVDGLSQVGASALTLITTQRSISEGRPIYLDRLRRIAIESLKQCGREWLMHVQGPITLQAALAVVRKPSSRFQSIIAADGDGLLPQDSVTHNLLAPVNPSTRALGAGGETALFVGPEGGFTPEELDSIAPRAEHVSDSTLPIEKHSQSDDSGELPNEPHSTSTVPACRMKFGPHILRIETAAVVGAAMVINLGRT